MSRSDTFLEKMVNGPRIILVTGHFGSGKTEFSVSLAYALGALKKAGDQRIKELALCDLDIENPYFRSRELTEPLEKEGIKVYSDPFHGKNGSELQTIDASILAPVENPDCRAILDTGGNHTGAMILNQFRRHFSEEYQMLCVVNQNRPGTDTPEKAAHEIRAIERVTELSVTGLISNSHFIWETTEEDVISGFAFAEEVGKLCSLPVLAACCSSDLARKIKPREGMEIFPVGMYMRQGYLDKKV